MEGWINVVFVHGDAGIGKTRFTTDFITEAINAANAHGERWQVYRAATGNPLDDWRGEEVLLLDDLRASAMDVNDWLTLGLRISSMLTCMGTLSILVSSTFRRSIEDRKSVV